MADVPSRRPHDRFWPISDMLRRHTIVGRFRGIADMAGPAVGSTRSRLTQCMVRPCVARELCRFGGERGLASMYPTFDWSVAPGHHGCQRACDLISGKASRRPNGSPVLARAGKTEPPCRLVLSQTSAGNSQFNTQTKRLTPWLASPRSFGHEPERSKQSWPVCLASAIARTLRCSRFFAASIQGLSP